MSLIFTSSNFISNIQEEASVKQHVFTYQPTVQKIKIENANKIVVHLWGGGGGGGGSHSITSGKPNAGAGGGGSFTILDFPYYPTRKEIFVEVNVGKGGNGGYYNNSQNYIPADNGGDSIVYFKDGQGRILKEFISYGGKGGQGNADLSSNGPTANGGNGGSNTLFEDYALMGAYYEQGVKQSFPQGGSEEQTYGDHCQMNYLSVSGSGGGSNFPVKGPNDGGSFILHKGGLGGATGTYVAGGGGSTYYGRGGTGGRQGAPRGGAGELNSGAGGGGSVSIFDINNTANSRRLPGGNGANGMVVIEVYY
jgi:hypothetical protein